MNNKKVIFLHIPKTAGQSIHAALIDAFGEETVCPARVNKQAVLMSVQELNRYNVFSGHLDWSLLDCVRGEKFTFTVLRKPIDRILSFYFYLRKEAQKLTKEELDSPDRQGMKAALELPPHQYFTAGPPNIRSFLNEHYDNFYTYYFAGRRFNGRSDLNGHLKGGRITQEKLVELAIENLQELDAVYTLDRVSDAFDDIRSLSPCARGQKNAEYFVNVNRVTDPPDRKDLLRNLGATEATFKRIKQYCEMDDELWRRFA